MGAESPSALTARTFGLRRQNTPVLTTIYNMSQDEKWYRQTLCFAIWLGNWDCAVLRQTILRLTKLQGKKRLYFAKGYVNLSAIWVPYTCTSSRHPVARITISNQMVWERSAFCKSSVQFPLRGLGSHDCSLSSTLRLVEPPFMMILHKQHPWTNTTASYEKKKKIRSNSRSQVVQPPFGNGLRPGGCSCT